MVSFQIVAIVSDRSSPARKSHISALFCYNIPDEEVNSHGIYAKLGHWISFIVWMAKYNVLKF